MRLAITVVALVAILLILLVFREANKEADLSLPPGRRKGQAGSKRQRYRAS